MAQRRANAWGSTVLDAEARGKGATDRIASRRGPDVSPSTHSFAVEEDLGREIAGGSPGLRSSRMDSPWGRVDGGEGQSALTGSAQLEPTSRLEACSTTSSPRDWTLQGSDDREASSPTRLSAVSSRQTSLESSTETLAWSSAEPSAFEEGRGALGSVTAAVEATSTLGTASLEGNPSLSSRALELGRSSARGVLHEARTRAEWAAVGAGIDAVTFSASGADGDGGLGDSLGSGIRSAAASVRSSLHYHRSKRATVASAAIALSDSDDLQTAEHTWRGAQATKRGVEATYDAIRYLNGTGPAPAAARAARAAKPGAPLSARTALRDAIKSRYSKSVTYAIQAARSKGEVIAGHGALTQAASTVHAMMSTVVSTISSAAESAVAALLGASPVMLLVALPFLLVIVAAAIGGSQQTQIEGLGPYSTQMAQYLRDQGWDDVHVAAAVANAIYESGGDQEALEINPAHEGDLSGQVNYQYEVNCGIFSWTDTSPGVGSMSQLKAYASMQRTEWQDLKTQLDFFMTVYLAGRQGALSRWLSISDLHEATKVFVAPTGGLLAGAQLAIESPAIDVRYDLADRVYAALYTGGGQDYADATAAQKAVVDATFSTPSLGPGLCAAWVTQAYLNAGLAAPYGDARDMYSNYCTSSDLGELKVGMIVAVPTVTNGTPASKVYGHVGIYIGDGMVRHSTEGQVFTTPLNEWMATYSSSSPCMWGFPPGLSGE